MTDIVIGVIIIAMAVRLVWYEVMVRALTAWISHIGKKPNDAQIDYLVQQEMKKLLLGK